MDITYPMTEPWYQSKHLLDHATRLNKQASIGSTLAGGRALS